VQKKSAQRRELIFENAGGDTTTRGIPLVLGVSNEAARMQTLRWVSKRAHSFAVTADQFKHRLRSSWSCILAIATAAPMRLQRQLECRSTRMVECRLTRAVKNIRPWCQRCVLALPHVLLFVQQVFRPLHRLLYLRRPLSTRPQ